MVIAYIAYINKGALSAALFMGLMATIAVGFTWLFSKIYLFFRGRTPAGPIAEDGVNSSQFEQMASIAHTGIVFAGGLADAQQSSGPLAAEHDRQYLEDLRTKAPLSSIATAVCLANGHVGVQLAAPPPAEKLLWSGVVGEIPVEYLPSTGTWSVEDLRRAEPIVRNIVSAALSYR